mmetsp:Transcript_9602/g.28676  ORF Transcript_9602/g.28676 Transcript_9602/m.28676 type:complete len:215 (-) Transcript_9602:42-686(-)
MRHSIAVHPPKFVRDLEFRIWCACVRIIVFIFFYPNVISVFVASIHKIENGKVQTTQRMTPGQHHLALFMTTDVAVTGFFQVANLTATRPMIIEQRVHGVNAVRNATQNAFCRSFLLFDFVKSTTPMRVYGLKSLSNGCTTKADEMFAIAFRENHVAFLVHAHLTFGTLDESHRPFPIFHFANVTPTRNLGAIFISEGRCHFAVVLRVLREACR